MRGHVIEHRAMVIYNQKLEQGLVHGLNKGQRDHVTAIQELKSGKTIEELQKPGIEESAIQLARQYL